jgi:hypothetical protein
MEHALPQSSFLLFAFFMILQIVIVSRWYPETKRTRLGAVTDAAQPLDIEQDAAW